jgi:hypothetical protein
VSLSLCALQPFPFSSFALSMDPLSFFILLTLYLSLSRSRYVFLPFFSLFTSLSPLLPLHFHLHAVSFLIYFYSSFCRNSAANFEALRGRYFPGAEGLMDTELLMKHMVGSQQQQQQQQQQHGAQDTEPFSLGDLRHCRQDAEDIIMENRYWIIKKEMPIVYF